MSKTKDARALEKKERQRGFSRECMARKRKENPEKFREIYRKYRSSRKDDPIFLERQREARHRHYYKINAEKIEKRKEVKQAKANEDEAKRIERNKRLIERARKKEEAALVKSLRPKLIVLTEEQRKEAKRQGKRNYKHVRRARINSCEVRATPKIIEEARKNAGDRCYYCGRKSKLTLDHFVPLAKGGDHCVSNLVFACSPCNSRKRDLDPFEFMASNVAISF
jgi:5-methylcytosine-specific restriction endonuclease McrA